MFDIAERVSSVSSFLLPFSQPRVKLAAARGGATLDELRGRVTSEKDVFFVLLHLQPATESPSKVKDSGKHLLRR